MRIWKDAEGNIIEEDQLYKWISDSVSDKEKQLIVGVDSHLHKHVYRFIAVVCLYKPGRGGFYYYTTTEQHKKEFKGNYPNRVKARMFHETSIAIELSNQVLETTGLSPLIHVDASPPESGELTSMFSDQLKGYVTGSGFECYIKPWSFVSSCIANKHSKG